MKETRKKEKGMQERKTWIKIGRKKWNLGRKEIKYFKN